LTKRNSELRTKTGIRHRRWSKFPAHHITTAQHNSPDLSAYSCRRRHWHHVMASWNGPTVLHFKRKRSYDCSIFPFNCRHSDCVALPANWYDASQYLWLLALADSTQSASSCACGHISLWQIKTGS